VNEWACTTTQCVQEVFVSSVKRANIFTTQYHPEKSGPSGLRRLASWLRAPVDCLPSSGSIIYPSNTRSPPATAYRPPGKADHRQSRRTRKRRRGSGRHQRRSVRRPREIYLHPHHYYYYYPYYFNDQERRAQPRQAHAPRIAVLRTGSGRDLPSGHHLVPLVPARGPADARRRPCRRRRGVRAPSPSKGVSRVPWTWTARPAMRSRSPQVARRSWWRERSDGGK
jgi:hypothetical protein